jgi:hypothetical protein
MAMAFACVSAHELRGGPAVSPCLIYHICLSHSPKNRHSHFIYVSYYLFLSLELLAVVFTAIYIILTPPALSDVTTADADREGGEWYPKTKFIADIVKKNGETKLVGEGCKCYHKMLNANILKENEMMKLVSEGHKHYQKVDEDPIKVWMDYIRAYANCLQSEGMSDDEITACHTCLGEAINDLTNMTECSQFNEVGYCYDVVSCEVTACNNKCTDEINASEGCLSYYAGCVHNQFESECLSGI